jgi:6-phosphogluconate dehydrogenase
MGSNLAMNLLDHNYQVVGFDNVVKTSDSELLVVNSIEDLVKELDAPRVVWVMVPSGPITEQVLEELSNLLDKGDIIIDGGNSRYTDSVRRGLSLKDQGLHFLDVGTSGGTTGARNGASLMIGGEKEVFLSIEHLFKAIAVKDGYAYLGNFGAGHFTKMVHNGIEYGMMQAIGEGFAVLEASEYDFDYKEVSKVWANGSIIEGLLMDMVLNAVSKDPKLESILGRVDDSGEGQWTIEEALRLKVSIPVIAQALFSRYKSKDDDLFGEKIVAAMRNEFGGHKVYKK